MAAYIYKGRVSSCNRRHMVTGEEMQAAAQDQGLEALISPVGLLDP